MSIDSRSVTTGGMYWRCQYEGLSTPKEEEVTSDAWDCGIVYRTDRRCFDVKRRNDGDSFWSPLSRRLMHMWHIAHSRWRVQRLSCGSRVCLHNHRISWQHGAKSIGGCSWGISSSHSFVDGIQYHTMKCQEIVLYIFCIPSRYSGHGWARADEPGILR